MDKELGIVGSDIGVWLLYCSFFCRSQNIRGFMFEFLPNNLYHLVEILGC